jgi:hypothetical protein
MDAYDILRARSKALRTMDDDQLLTELSKEMANVECNSIEYNALYHQTILDEIEARIYRNNIDWDDLAGDIEAKDQDEAMTAKMNGDC